MWNVTVHGLSEGNLTELVLDRSESLNDLRTHALLDIGDLAILGSYQYKGTPTGWSWLGAQEINSGVTTNNLIHKPWPLSPGQFCRYRFDFTFNSSVSPLPFCR